MVLELLEKGELQKLHKKWWFDKGECVADDTKVPYYIPYCHTVGFGDLVVARLPAEQEVARSNPRCR